MINSTSVPQEGQSFLSSSDMVCSPTVGLFFGPILDLVPVDFVVIFNIGEDRVNNEIR